MSETDQLLRGAQLRWRVVFCLWFILVTTATHWPRVSLGVPQFVPPDKLFHFVSFGVLTITLWCTGWVNNRWQAVLLAIGWVIVDEVTQAILPLNRPFSWADMSASTLGVIAGASWMGTLSKPSMAHILDTITRLLASTKAWIVLGTISVVTTFLIAGSISTLLWFWFGDMQSSMSLFLGLLFAASVLVLTIVRWCNLQVQAKQLFPKLAWRLSRTVLFCLLFMFLWWEDSFVGPWTIGLFYLSISSSRDWRLAIGETFSLRSM